MKNFYLIIVSILCSNSLSFAQSVTRPGVEKGQFTYHLLAAASYEIGVNRISTLRFSGPLELGFLYESNMYGSELHTYLRPVIQTEFRYYYNLDKRAAKGKRTTNNSGNFIAPVVNLFGPAIAKSENVTVANFASVLGTVWGIQRNYGKKFNFQLSIGPGIGLSEDEIEFVPMGNLSLGFRI